EALKRGQDRARTSIGALSRRVEALTRAQAAQATTTDIVRSTEGSVVTVFAGSGEGSAFAVESSGAMSTVLTDYHVIAGAWVSGSRQVQVTTESRDVRGTIVAVRPSADLALVRIPVSLTPLSFAQGSQDIGTPVVVIGSPYGLE